MSSQASSETFIDMTFLKFYLIANFERQTTKTVKQYFMVASNIVYFTSIHFNMNEKCRELYDLDGDQLDFSVFLVLAFL